MGTSIFKGRWYLGGSIDDAVYQCLFKANGDLTCSDTGALIIGSNVAGSAVTPDGCVKGGRR